MRQVFIVHGDDEREVGCVDDIGPSCDILRLSDAIEEIIESSDDDEFTVTIEIR